MKSIMRLVSLVFVICLVAGGVNVNAGLSSTSAEHAPGTNIFITTGNDIVDPNDGKCSLREAVIAANTDTSSGGAVGECPAGNGWDTITLGIGTYNLTISGADQFAAVGDLDVRESLNIYGWGPSNSIINADFQDRVFDVLDFFDDLTLHLADLTIREGTIPDGDDGGGAVRMLSGHLEAEDVVFKGNFAGGEGSDAVGGALTIKGSALIYNCQFENNYGYRGGAIFFSGAVTDASISESLFLKNGAGTGGAIDSYGDVTITNTTFSGNKALKRGGGVIQNHGTMTVEFSTLVDNSATTDVVADISGAIYNYVDGTIRLRSTILAGNTVDSGTFDNCNNSGTWLTSSLNLEDKSTCPLGASNLYNSDPRLGLLGFWGGPTQTYPVLYDSPAIDAGGLSDCPAIDQRAFSRPEDGNDNGIATCDIGAFEAESHYTSIYLPMIVD